MLKELIQIKVRAYGFTLGKRMVRKKRKGMKERGKAIDKLRRMNGLLRQILFGFMLVF